MSLDKGFCWFAIIAGILLIIIAIPMIADSIKYKKYQPVDYIAMVCGIISGISLVIIGLFYMPYTNAVEVTDAVTFVEMNEKYLIEIDGELIDTTHYEKIAKHDNENYQLKIKTDYSMAGREVDKTYILVIPVDIIQKG